MRTPKLYTTKLHNLEITYTDQTEFHELKNELFTRNVYYFETLNPEPIIIDVGSHIGMSTLYFKRLYPNARITAIEPHPFTFKILEQNLWQNHCEDVTALNIALDPTETELTLYADPQTEWLSTTSIHQGAWTGDQETESFIVPAQPLSNFITQKTDLVKLDIEGAEQRLLTESQPVLHLIKEMFIEFHRHPSQDLKTCIEFLENNGYKVTLFMSDVPISFAKAPSLTLIHAKK